MLLKTAALLLLIAVIFRLFLIPNKITLGKCWIVQMVYEHLSFVYFHILPMDLVTIYHEMLEHLFQLPIDLEVFQYYDSMFHPESMS